jgi:hypothetical protein
MIRSAKTGRDRVLNPLEAGFSHELPDNDNRTQARRRYRQVKARPACRKYK